ncbi:rRNA pseudouridine synthase [Candidatus Azambacteria bacterium]|nr:rRNA pseudouridine synthase [Candidatus Azambacteria bacterium]
MRINKYLRDKGFASRREADELIAAGKVFVNGVPAKEGMQIDEGDEVTVPSRREKTYTYLAYYKPTGLATQAPAGEESVITNWQGKGIFPIGRLDKESEGLLILTNDRRLTARVLGADAKVEKEYLVHVREPLRQGIPAIMKKGMDTQAFGRLLPADARLVDKHAIFVTLQEGKRHQLRVMFSELGYTISALKRVRVGHVTLGNLRPGQTRALNEQESKKFFEERN